MTYLGRDTSIEDGSPFFLYEFNIGATTYRFTDLPDDIIFNSETWTAWPVKHTEVQQSNEVAKNQVKIDLPIGNSFTDQYIGKTPESVVTFTLYRSHIGETEFIVAYKGRVTTHEISTLILKLTCESVYTSLKRTGVRARFLLTCRHALYGRGCNLDRATFAEAGTATGITGLDLTVTEASGFADGFFTGGYIEFPDGSRRSIANHVGTTITLINESQYLIDNPPISTPVTLYPGCDRTLDTCINKFNNVLNQGGFRWIPNKNPTGGNSIV